MASAKNEDFKLFINNKLIGELSCIEVFDSHIKETTCFCYDGGDGPEIILEIYKKNIVSIDQKTKEIKIDTRNPLDMPFG